MMLMPFVNPIKVLNDPILMGKEGFYQNQKSLVKTLNMIVLATIQMDATSGQCGMSTHDPLRVPILL